MTALLILVRRLLWEPDTLQKAKQSCLEKKSRTKSPSLEKAGAHKANKASINAAAALPEN
jgi:hypothetical protein